MAAGPIKQFLRGSSAIAAIVALAWLVSCTADSTGPRDTRRSPDIRFEAVLNGLTITTALGAQAAQAAVFVTRDSILCAMKVLGGQEDFRLSGEGACGTFSLELRYVPANGACQPGGLYLIQGSVAPLPLGSPPVEDRQRTLAGWDAQAEATSPWITPFDVPRVVTVLARPHDGDGHRSLEEMGGWTYTLGYGVDVVVPTGCSLTTDLELTLTSANTPSTTRVHRYAVTTARSGGAVTTTIAAQQNAQPAMIHTGGPDTTLVRVSVSGLDALRDAQVRAGLTYPGQAPTLPAAVVAEPVFPAIVIAANDTPPPLLGPGVMSISAHLLHLVGSLTASLREVSGPTEVTASVSVTFVQPLVGGEFALPVLLMPPHRLVVDGRSTCDGVAPGEHTICDLAVVMQTWLHSLGPTTPPPFARFEIGITFWNDDAVPLLRVEGIRLLLEYVVDG
jgi:hypothetical protein